MRTVEIVIPKFSTPMRAISMLLAMRCAHDSMDPSIAFHSTLGFIILAHILISLSMWKTTKKVIIPETTQKP